MQRIRRRVYDGRGVRDGVGERPAHLSFQKVHKLRSAEEEQRAVLETRRILLQLPRRSSGQPLPPRLLPYFSLPLLISPLAGRRSVPFFVYSF
ncbi:hypothetical protein LINPERPRIM_LOCUS17608 [Linum perenne]